MHYSITEKEKEKAILVGLVLPGMTRGQEKDSLDELVSLAETAGAEVVDRVLQDRHEIRPSTLIGKGLVHQLARKANDLDARMILFDTDLTPVQMKNLEKEIQRKIIDRSGIILDIFARRARSRESQIQVELAQLQYFLPRLTRQWTHLSRQEAGIGTRGPGETQLEADRRVIRKKIAHLKNELKKIEGQRRIRRKTRKPFKKVALVGYTNAGKSTLMNLLADSNVFVENRLFATLDATIRSVKFPDFGKVLLIDTVGFIRKLPHDLVASFKSTLEETEEADLLLHIVDAGHPNYEDQMDAVRQVLRDLNLKDKPVLLIFNKVDLVDQREELVYLRKQYPEAVFTSAIKGIGLEKLLQTIEKKFKEEEIEAEIRLPVNATKMISQIHDTARVIDKVYEDGMVLIRFRARPRLINQIQSSVRQINEDIE